MTGDISQSFVGIALAPIVVTSVPINSPMIYLWGCPNKPTEAGAQKPVYKIVWGFHWENF